MLHNLKTRTFAKEIQRKYMDIQGKIIAALEPRSGMSKSTGNSWKSQDFVIETHEDYPKKCVFTVFGEDKLQQMNIQLGDELTVSIDVNAHEYNGRWYNDLRAWRVTRGNTAVAGPTTTNADAGVPSSGNDPADDLPF